MRGDPEKARRGELVRRLGALREMLPGAFVERQFQCGKPNCRCADGVHLHRGFQLSVRIDGRPRAVHIPAVWADDVRGQVEMYKRAQALVAQICQMNLQRFLRRKAAKEPLP